MKTRVLQRLILPKDGDADILPLYAEGELESVMDTDPGNAATDTVRAVTRRQSGAQVISRTSYRVPAGERTSFATYFNAFPAAYWRRWTIVTDVTLRVRASGTGAILVYRSNATGVAYRVDLGRVTGNGQELSFSLPLNTFGDGGWYWFDASAEEEDLIIESACWETQRVDDRPVGRVTIGITTFNRPTDCATVLTQLGRSETLPAVLSEVVVVDQGDRKVVDDSLYPEACELLGSRLRVVDQLNLGGSGGFSRSMLEAVEGGSDYVLLLDDDVRVDPEGIVRAATFADLARVPTIVGGHMFSMYERTSLHALAESVDMRRIWWGPARGTFHDHDLAQAPIRATKWMHRRADADYNGWWMCLIPTSVVRRIGMSLPFFIKWDDAEYGLRARAEGVPTVSLPGAAVWHVPWTAKDDSLDWQAYFHMRNRLVTALIHSPLEHGGSFLRDTFANQIKHLLCSQYSVAELRLRAMEDVMRGPEHLQQTIPTIVSDVRALRAGYDDSAVEREPDVFPDVRSAGTGPVGPLSTPASRIGRYLLAAKGALRQLTPVRDGSRSHPEARVPWSEAHWWMLSQFDSAIVSNSDGSGVSWYHRDRDLARDQLSRTISLHRRFYSEWGRLSGSYRSGLNNAAGADAWRSTFGLEPDQGASARLSEASR